MLTSGCVSTMEWMLFILSDPELAIGHLGHQGKAFGGAASIGQDVYFVVVPIAIDTHDDHEQSKLR